MQPNGRAPARPATEIKEYVSEAQERQREGVESNDAGVRFTVATISTGYGDVTVKLVAESAFQNSHYQVFHPRYGNWIGYLNGRTQRGEYGYKVGKPTQM